MAINLSAKSDNRRVSVQIGYTAAFGLNHRQFAAIAILQPLGTFALNRTRSKWGSQDAPSIAQSPVSSSKR
jgi:hypothetical protein